MTSTTTSPTRERLSRRAITVLAASVLAVLLWWVETHLLGVDLTVAPAGASPRPVTAAATAATAAASGLAGWLTVALLRQTAARRARRVWTVLAGAVLLLSLLGPLAGTGPGATAGLLALHLAVGGVLLLGLRPAVPSRGYGE